ncbi:hypothetical protein M430DRAFT_35246 [Amorphotheca resinae ATCC 22711]|uniref:Mediator of RNA polymerase II transcription subunit 19 n=1 Tax=Amorphotheca resinae ATCC 22711 TaxID=857342 RepID=A0A2T3B2S7_AMORE|nr:hypothetical protein M430DRAFT_35246 [Amorphotheca resinae ATCC 22711]PSS18843.1 hypothetical protein M430DRAFT_35246 [Amorphotheca resinae ATCC 22711]
MPSDLPQTPQSPSYDSTYFPSKLAASPRTGSSLPTPAHSINGSMSSTTPDVVAEAAHVEDPSNKRKRDIEDGGDRDQKKVHLEDSRLRIEDLHLDVGEKYLLCRTPHPPFPIPLKEDLFQRYGLTDLAETVARSNPDGSKKTVRKTYKGHIKRVLKLSGNFDSVKRGAEEPNSLVSMMCQPDEVWNAQYAQASKEIETGIPQPVLANLGKAVTMARGVIPKDMWNSSVLGELVPPSAPAQPAKGVQNGVKTQQPPQAAGVRTVKPEVPRPKRNIKKRTYGDASFEGYGEGFVDDDAQETGYSTGDGDERTGRKRPKKTIQSNSFQGPVARQNSYGPGMVGV